MVGLDTFTISEWGSFFHHLTGENEKVNLSCR